MVSVPTARASNALSKKSRIVFSNHNAAYLRVASLTTTTITVDDASALTGTALYTTSTPGVMQIMKGQAASDNDFTAEVDGISGNVLTVDEDFTATGLGSAPALADGDLIAVFPPQAIELRPNGSHTLKLTAVDDETLGLTDTFLTHNTTEALRVSGSIPFFLPKDSHALSRLLAFGFGMYDKSGTGVHTVVPLEDDDGTYANSERASVYVSDANAVAEQLFGNLFCTGISLSIPESGPATGNLDVVGNVYAREVGGTNKVYKSGATEYNQSDLSGEAGDRFTHLHAIVQRGGTFGDAPTDLQDAFVTSCDISYTKTSTEPQPLGNEYNVDAEEGAVSYTVSLSRLFQNDTFFDDYMGAAGDPRLGKTESRLLVRLTDGTRILDLDCPNGKISDHTINRDPQGRVTESFTFTAVHLLSSGQIDTANPLVRVRHNSGIDVDVLTSLSNA